MSETIIGQQSEIEATVTPSKKQVSFKTKLKFMDVNRAHETVISVQPPQLTTAGTLQFLKEYRLLTYERQAVFSYETEQLDDIRPNGLVVSVKEK